MQMAARGQYKAFPSKEREIEDCKAFLQDFARPGSAEKPYLVQLQRIANRTSMSLSISMDDLNDYERDSELVTKIIRNTKRYQDVFAKAADSILPEPTVDVDDSTPYLTMMRMRKQLLAKARAEQPDEPIQSLPEKMSRSYEVRILPRAADKPYKLRDVRAPQVGSLVSVRGIVTRVTDVQPQVEVQCYLCLTCGFESYQVVEGKEYTPLSTCPSSQCVGNKVNGRLFQMPRGTKFRKYQEVRLQELPMEVPVGSVPRSVSLRLFGDVARSCRPGDVVTVSGVFLPAPHTGFRGMRAGLTTDTFIEVSAVQVAKKNYAEMVLSPEQQNDVTQLAQSDGVYDRLASSLSPEIYGQLDVKKALLLVMVGGVTKTRPDGLRIRGDINLLMVGDPGMAKSQMLKHITKVAPRAVYTTGKGSTGVGLTASVLRDPVSGDMTLEGGALVLADMGVCCIDEFDKMEESDRTAIHEVMEQQTVSIAKAGITTTLNARTAVIAAANPVYGRYNPRRSVSDNLSMPAALLSRFDLTFIMLDKPDEVADRELAKYVCRVHRERDAPAQTVAALKPAFVRAYIAAARRFQPFVPRELQDYIATQYVSLRRETAEDEREQSQAGANDRGRFCTARSLLAILRLAQAHARIHFRDEVAEEDVGEALRLLAATKAALESDNEHRPAASEDSISWIFDLVRRYREAAADDEGRLPDVLKRSDALRMAVRRGISEAKFDECLKVYEDSNVWVVRSDAIHFKP